MARDRCTCHRLRRSFLSNAASHLRAVVGRTEKGNMGMSDANSSGEVAPWHAMSVQEVVRRLGSNTGRGLDGAEASDRLKKYGPNRLPAGRKRGPLMRFFVQFNNILVYVLLAAG